jgi:hypothetical protein
MSSEWRCDRHGDIAPYHRATAEPERVLELLATRSRVPVWMPDPMPVNWYLSGIAWAGDDRTAARAVALAATGPAPTGGPGDLIVVADEPGVGLGASLAGLRGPGADAVTRRPEAKVEAAGHQTALWPLASPPDRAGFVGEALGVWLWIVLWPADAALLLLEDLVIRDCRDGFAGERPLFGAASPHLGI